MYSMVLFSFIIITFKSGNLFHLNSIRNKWDLRRRKNNWMLVRKKLRHLFKVTIEHFVWSVSQKFRISDICTDLVTKPQKKERNPGVELQGLVYFSRTSKLYDWLSDLIRFRKQKYMDHLQYTIVYNSLFKCKIRKGQNFG